MLHYASSHVSAWALLASPALDGALARTGCAWAARRRARAPSPHRWTTRRRRRRTPRGGGGACRGRRPPPPGAAAYRRRTARPRRPWSACDRGATLAQLARLPARALARGYYQEQTRVQQNGVLWAEHRAPGGPLCAQMEGQPPEPHPAQRVSYGQLWEGDSVHEQNVGSPGRAPRAAAAGRPAERRGAGSWGPRSRMTTVVGPRARRATRTNACSASTGRAPMRSFRRSAQPLPPSAVPRLCCLCTSPHSRLEECDRQGRHIRL